MPKSTKRFVLSTSALNSKKFRTLTEGADLESFKQNPIMYWMHQDAEQVLPLGFWEDIKIEGDEITATPNFDDNDPFAMQIYHKVEHGTLRAASIEVMPDEVDTNRTNWVKGQKLPTVTKFKIGEASIVDRPSNASALVKLKHNGQSITLNTQGDAEIFFNSLTTTNIETMNKIKLSHKASKALKLSEGAELDAEEVVGKLLEVIDQNETKVAELEAETLKLKEAEETNKITTLVEKAIADRKILAGEKEMFIKLAKADYKTIEELIANKAAAPTVESQLKNVDENAATLEELKDLRKLSWGELFEKGLVEKMKKLDPETLKLKYKEKFGKEPSAEFMAVKV